MGRTEVEKALESVAVQLMNGEEVLRFGVARTNRGR
jgi:hypothetical protein